MPTVLGEYVSSATLVCGGVCCHEENCQEGEVEAEQKVRRNQTHTWLASEHELGQGFLALGGGGTDETVDDISESHVKALDPLPGTMHGCTHKAMFT